jgi:hypothetical protein
MRERAEETAFGCKYGVILEVDNALMMAFGLGLVFCLLRGFRLGAERNWPWIMPVVAFWL